MKDNNGTTFIRALSEGTRLMVDEMKKYKLPSPKYEVSQTETKVLLYNNNSLRLTDNKENNSKTTEFTNLYPLMFYKGNYLLNDNEINFLYIDFFKTLSDKLISASWFIDDINKHKFIAFQKQKKYKFNNIIDEKVGFYPAFTFVIKKYWKKYYLCIDYTLKVKNRLTLNCLLSILTPQELIDNYAVAKWGTWKNCKILSLGNSNSQLEIIDDSQIVSVPNNIIYPNLSITMIDKILKQYINNFDIYKEIKNLSLCLDTNASYKRANKIQQLIEDMSFKNIFPLFLDGMTIKLTTQPLNLEKDINKQYSLVVRELEEPDVEFKFNKRTKNIREGITNYGSTDFTPKDIKIIPICISNYHEKMETLINNIKLGQYNYKGSERNFSTKIYFKSIIKVSSTKEILPECKKIIYANPDWIGDPELKHIFFIHTPENEFSIDYENSPYFQLKHYFLENGIPCQMVDTQTLKEPKFKDLNLALNIITKCGRTPWVLPDTIPDADFIIGLSYTSRLDGKNRIMGFANVFNAYGRWKFYSGNSTPFTFSDRIIYFKELISQTLKQLELSETPSIYFHYTKKFSKDERNAILEEAKKIRPKGIYNFIWINSKHNIRLYDKKPESNGSLARGNYVITSPYQLLLSTTGCNIYKKTLGTPITLEINIYTEAPEEKKAYKPDLKSLAKQILNLTKLNWASTESICGEPITIKYAKSIARFMEIFNRQDKPVIIHPVLKKTPWFI